MSLFLAMALFQAATSAPSSATPVPPNDDRKMVCRNMQGTGSRLNTQRVCLPKREWQRMWDESRTTMSSLQDKHSTQPQGPPR